HLTQRGLKALVARMENRDSGVRFWDGRPLAVTPPARCVWSERNGSITSRRCYSQRDDWIERGGTARRPHTAREAQEGRKNERQRNRRGRDSGVPAQQNPKEHRTPRPETHTDEPAQE